MDPAKPCPFCGDERVEFNSGYKCYRVDCGGSGPCYSDPEKALDKWNNAYCWQRESALLAVIAELVEALKSINHYRAKFCDSHRDKELNEEKIDVIIEHSLAKTRREVSDAS